MADGASLAALVAMAEARDIGLGRLTLEKEAAETAQSTERVRARMARMLDVMAESAAEGLRGDARSASGMVGGDARRLEAARLAGASPDDLLAAAAARAMAVSEVNAAMGRIVAAPTAGAAGVLPGVLLSLMEVRGTPQERVVEAMFAAAAVGAVIAERATLSGAEGGCQAETGSAAAMAAAAAVEALGGTPAMCAQAVAFSLQNMLGLVCDPIGGLVQIPCIERNATAAVKAVQAARIAMNETEGHKVSLDQVIRTMYQTGLDMQSRYKETSLAGLALNVIEC